MENYGVDVRLVCYSDPMAAKNLHRVVVWPHLWATAERYAEHESRNGMLVRSNLAAAAYFLLGQAYLLY